MDISSLTTVTSSSTRSGANNTPSNSVGAPFADVMQRAAADSPAPSSGTPAGATAQASNAANLPATLVAATPSASRDESSFDQATADVGPGATSHAATDARQILQALASGDMSSLHGALASLADGGSRAKGEFGQVESGQGDHVQLEDMLGYDASGLDANALAAMVAALPQAAATPAGDNAALSSSAGGGLPGASQGMLQSMMLTSAGDSRGRAIPTAGSLMEEATPTPADGDETSGVSTRVNASLLPANPTAASTLTIQPGASSASTNGQTFSVGGVGGSAGVALSGTLPDGTADAVLTSMDRDGLDITALSNGRADAGSLANLTSSLANATSVATATTAATPTNPTITASVQSPQWPASFGQQVLQMHQRGDQQMSLRLHPQELGPLSVSLTVQDQQAQLQIVSAHAPVRAAVEAAMPQLRQALADSGIALGEAMVGDQGMFQQGQSREGRSSDDDGSRRAIGGAGALLASGSLDTGSHDTDELASRQAALTANGNISLYA